APVGGFLIAGPPQSGRTAAMRALATALHRFDPTMRLYLFVPGRRSELAGLALWTGCYLGAEQARDGAEQLTAAVKAAQRAPAAVFVENAMEFASGAADIPLQELVRTCL